MADLFSLQKNLSNYLLTFIAPGHKSRIQKLQPKTRMDSEKKAFLITGCKPGGIGHALAEKFHSRGFRVFATARDTSTMSDLKKSGIECFSLVVDDPKSIATCHEEVQKVLDGLNGKAFFSPAVETDTTQAKRLLETNLLGIITMNQTFFPEVLKVRGTIVNVGSTITHIPLPMKAVYCASKEGLYAYSEVMRVEFAPLGVRVRFIQVGNVNTNILRRKNHLRENSLWAPVSDVFEKKGKKMPRTREVNPPFLPKTSRGNY